MKKLFLSIFVIALLLLQATVSLAQAGAVYTVAGGGTSTANGVPATTASLGFTTGVGIDGFGNIYVAENHAFTVRKIDPLGNIYTIVGSTIGFSGDGGPATAAKFNDIQDIHVDPVGNIYIADYGNVRVRKFTAATGIVTTIAGIWGGAATADGILATNASVAPKCVYVDDAGFVYTGDNTGRVRKINPSTGIITTVAGGGSSTADGIPATVALLDGPINSLKMDGNNNLYILDSRTIRKVSVGTGRIHTVFGGGSSTGENVPATSAFLGHTHSFDVDSAGNIFVSDFGMYRIRRVDVASGLVVTVAGGGGSTAEGAAATSTTVRAYKVYVDPISDQIFYTNQHDRLRKFSFAPIYGSGHAGGIWSTGGYGSDSFKVAIHKECSGPQLTFRVRHYQSGLTIRTYYGDGAADTVAVAPAYIGVGGYAITRHNYAVNDSYTVRHLLCNGATVIDSFNYTYNHRFCTMLPVRFFNDWNANCSKDTLEAFMGFSTLAEVDSNGVPIDTIAAASGFNYNAYGNSGDVYMFRILSLPPAFSAVCPSTGVISDTLVTGTHTAAPLLFGIGCTSGSAFDLRASAKVNGTRPNDQWGHIYLSNTACSPTDGRVTLQFSPKYIYVSGASPAPVSSTPHSITWDLAAIGGTETTPRDLYFRAEYNPFTGYLRLGDTVNEHISITPTTGDADTSNNIVIRNDTVRTSYDPNAIEVNPANCYDNDGELLHFTVHFENMGSAPAENIYVMDTMSDNLDISSLKIISSSHLMFVSKYQSDGRTIMKFDFPNIMLADSSRHGERDGMFMYDIRAKTGLATGATIMSRVGIYFDYNDVVMTNEVHNVKGCPVPVAVNTTAGAEGTVLLYPNPAGDVLNVTTEAGSYSSLTICNAMGQSLITQGLNTATTTVDIKALPTGVYYVTLQGTDGTVVRKVVKW